MGLGLPSGSGRAGGGPGTPRGVGPAAFVLALSGCPGGVGGGWHRASGGLPAQQADHHGTSSRRVGVRGWQPVGPQGAHLLPRVRTPCSDLSCWAGGGVGPSSSPGAGSWWTGAGACPVCCVGHVREPSAPALSLAGCWSPKGFSSEYGQEGSVAGDWGTVSCVPVVPCLGSSQGPELLAYLPTPPPSGSRCLGSPFPGPRAVGDGGEGRSFLTGQA